MHLRPLDLASAATLFVETDLGAEVARMPSIDRPFRYFETVRDAVRVACEKLGDRQLGSFLVQGGERYDVAAMQVLYADLTWPTRDCFEARPWLMGIGLR